MPKPRPTFRLKTSQLFLTYSQCKLTKARVTEYLEGYLTHIETLIVSEEEHKDGGRHFHVYVKLSKQLETTDPRYLDIDGYHPNIQGKLRKDKVIAYILKEDVNPALIHRLDTTNPVGYKRRKADYEEWVNDVRSNKWVPQVLKQVTLPDAWVGTDGTRGPTHQFTGRDGGGMVLIGPSEIGKTTMVLGDIDPKTGETIPGWLTPEIDNVHVVGIDRRDLHYEGYVNQAWVVYDDMEPHPSHLLRFLQRYPTARAPVPGAPRYKHASMTGPATRNVVVILNPQRNSIDWTEEGLNSRFRVYRYSP